MNLRLLETLQKEFPFLSKQGFTFISMKEDHRLSSVRFESSNFKIRFDILDGILDVFIAIYYPTLAKHGHLYGLQTYVEYLAEHPVELLKRIPFPSDDVKILSNLLEQYMERLKPLGKAGNYDEIEKKLTDIAVSFSQRNWENFRFQQGKPDPGKDASSR